MRWQQGELCSALALVQAGQVGRSSTQLRAARVQHWMQEADRPAAVAKAVWTNACRAPIDASPLLLQGDVLEVSAGTGRNLPYYDLRRLRSLTLTDTSRHMLVNAADKYAEMGASTGSARVRFELADAQHLAATPDSSSGSSESSSRAHAAAGAAQQPPEARQPQEQMQGAVGAPHRPQLRQQQTFPPRSFDCVVDTFGLCSQQDPVTALKVGWMGQCGRGSPHQWAGAAQGGDRGPCLRFLSQLANIPHRAAWLQEMARVCKPGGRILLLQHGKGTWGFVNSILDSGAGVGGRLCCPCHAVLDHVRLPACLKRHCWVH